MESVKLERYNNAFMEQLNIILGTETKNPVLKQVVVNAVKITNDLSFAKVYFTCFNEDKKLVLKELKDSSGFLRHELSEKIDRTFINYPCITFIIGGSSGISENIKNRCNYKLSFSKLTYPHGLFRLILLEQIYRSFKILNNETYHK